MSPSGLHLNKPVVVVFILIIVGGIVWFKMSGSVPKVMVDEAASAADQSTADLEKMVVNPAEVTVKIDGEEVKVAYREMKPENSKLDVLFLHGMKFSSATWVSKPLWTVQFLSKNGFRAVAIDLPGYGKTPSSTKSSAEPAAFIEAVIAELKLVAPVIVSPSMSGQYSLPYLFKDPSGVLSRSRGYVPVAPVGTSKYSADQYKSLQIPTLAVYGENDKGLGQESKKNFDNLPNKEFLEMKGAGHACYLDSPSEFHTKFLQFLQSLAK